MKIALFSDSFFPELGGIQDSVALLARELGARGHRVEFFAPRASTKDYAIAKLPVHEIDLGPNVHIRREFSIHLPSPTLQSRFVPPTLRRWRELREFRPDVIHVHTFFGLGWEALRAAKKLGVRLVGTNHSAVSEFSAYMPFGAKRLGALSVSAVVWYYNHCDFVSGPSRSVIEEMISYGLRVPSGVVSNPIDSATFRPAPESERAALRKKYSFHGPTIAYAGRLGMEKKLDVLIRALPMVRKEIPETLFVMAGHGSDEARLTLLAKELGVTEHVRFLGTLSKPALAEVFQAADIFAIASTSETQSMVLLQGMSCGLPAVGANWRSLKEYIPADAGFLARPDDPADFADKIVRVLKSPDAQKSMGSQALAFAQQFSIKNTIDTWERIYAGRNDVSP